MEAPMVRVFVLAAVCMCAVAATMVFAAVSDVRSREVDDIHWKAVIAVGIPCSAAAAMEGSTALPAVLMALSSVFMAIHVLTDALPWPASLIVSGAFAVLSYCSAEGIQGRWTLLAPFVSSLMFLFMYRFRVLAGGADAKALIALAMVPQYPSIPGIPAVWQVGWPLSAVPLSVSVLVMAVMLSLVPMLMLGIRNALEGSYGPRMFTEYRMPLDDVRGSFVWLAEDMEDGEVIRRRVMDDVDNSLSKLDDAGITDVAVTPMVPFVLYIAAGLLVVLLLGNPLFAVL
jgi:hypothetical protein